MWCEPFSQKLMISKAESTSLAQAKNLGWEKLLLPAQKGPPESSPQAVQCVNIPIGSFHGLVNGCASLPPSKFLRESL